MATAMLTNTKYQSAALSGNTRKDFEEFKTHALRLPEKPHTYSASNWVCATCWTGANYADCHQRPHRLTLATRDQRSLSPNPLHQLLRTAYELCNTFDNRPLPQFGPGF